MHIHRYIQHHIYIYTIYIYTLFINKYLYIPYIYICYIFIYINRSLLNHVVNYVFKHPRPCWLAGWWSQSLASRPARSGTRSWGANLASWWSNEVRWDGQWMGKIMGKLWELVGKTWENNVLHDTGESSKMGDIKIYKFLANAESLKTWEMQDFLRKQKKGTLCRVTKFAGQWDHLE